MNSHLTESPPKHSPSTGGSVWRENKATSGFGNLDVREMWAFRELLWFLAARDVRVRYKQAVLGGTWAVVRPVVGAMVFLIVFRRVAKVSSDGLPYVPFAYLSFAAWSCISSGVTSSMASLVDNAALVTKIYFPRIIAPAAAVLPALLDFCVSLILLVPMLLITHTNPGWGIVLLPVFIVLLALVPFAFGLWLVTLHVQYRDINYVTNLLMQVWLFLSPVAYGFTMITPHWRIVYALNPAVGVLTALRWSALGGPWPGVPFAVSCAVLVGVLVSGLAYFSRVERRFADII
jgi:lipopolysaccharide transport system permease protein